MIIRTYVLGMIIMKNQIIFLAVLLHTHHSVCKPGCLKCSKYNTCQVCDTTTGYYLLNEQCFLKMIPNCKQISHSGECLQCTQNYYLEKTLSACLAVAFNKRVEFCLSYDSNQKCSQCQSSYIVENGFCRKVTKEIPNCHFYWDDSTCADCINGYTMSNNFRKCIPTPNNLRCSAYTFITCSECRAGHYLDPNYYLTNFTSLNFLKQKIVKLKQKSTTNWTAPVVCRPTNVSSCLQFSAFDKCAKCAEDSYLEKDRCFPNPISEVPNCLVYETAYQCKECRKDHYLFNDTYCAKTPTIDNCLKYDSTSYSPKCTECASEYFTMNKKCHLREISPKIANCRKVSLYDDVCDECSENFVLNFDQTYCFEKLTNCLKYSKSSLRSTTLRCEVCQEGHYLNTTRASPECLVGNVANCQEYKTNSEVCVACVNGFYLANNTCNAHVQIDNCKTFSPSVGHACLVCERGFFPFQLSSCLLVDAIPNCLQYDKEAKTCTTCDKFSYLANGRCNLIPGDWVNCEKYDGQFCFKCKPNYMLNLLNSTTDCISPLSYVTKNCESTNVKNESQNFTWGLVQPNPIVCSSCSPGHYPFKPADNEAICVRTSDLFLFSTSFSLTANCFRYGFNSLNRLVCMECHPSYFIRNYWPDTTASNNIVCDLQTAGAAEVIILDDLNGFVNITVPIGLLSSEINMPNCKYAGRKSLFNQASLGSIIGDFVCISPSVAYAPVFDTTSPFLRKDTSNVLFGLSHSDTVDFNHGYASSKDGPSVRPLVFNYRGVRFVGNPVLLSSIANYVANNLSKCELLWYPGNKGSGGSAALAVGLRIDPAVPQCLKCIFGIQRVAIPDSSVSRYPSCLDFDPNVCSASIVVGGLPSYLNAVLGCHSCTYDPVTGTQRYPTVHLEYGGLGGSIDRNEWCQFKTDSVQNGFSCSPQPSKLLNSATASFALAVGVDGGPVAAISGCAVFGEMSPIGSTANTIIASNPLISICLACVKGTYPVYSQSSSTNNIPHFAVVRCNAIPNCEVRGVDNAFNSCTKCVTFILDEGNRYYAFADAMLTNCQLSKSENCFILREIKSPNEPTDCDICQSGFVENPDGLCEKVLVPNGSVLSSFSTSYITRFYRTFVSRSTPFVGFDSLSVRIHYLLSHHAVQYGTRVCESNSYTLSSPSSFSSVVCVYSDYVFQQAFSSSPSTRFVSNCLTYSALMSDDQIVYACESCLNSLIATVDKKTCVQSVDNCLVARNQPNQNSCYQCESGYINVNGVCSNGKIPNCLLYKNSAVFDFSIDFQCRQCQSGFYLTSDSKNCLKGNSVNCDSYALGNPDNCLRCVQGYFLVSLADGIKYCYKAPENTNCNEFALSTFDVPLNVNRIVCKRCSQSESVVYGHSLYRSEDERTIRSACLPFEKVSFCVEYDQWKTTLNQNRLTCLECESDYFLSISNNTCIKRTNKSTKCRTYSKTSADCAECASGYYFDKRRSDCESNPTGIVGCLSYFNSRLCLTCKAPYYVKEGRCLHSRRTIDNCEKYSSDSVCEKCLKGYFKQSDTQCKPITISFCEEAVSETVCSKCLDQHVLVNGFAGSECELSSLPNCETVFGEGLPKCKKCKKDFVLDQNGDCQQLRTSIQHCVEYLNPQQCKSCLSPTVLNENATACIRFFYSELLDPNCAHSFLRNSPVCSQCSFGQLFVNDSCLDCFANSFSEGCLACDSLNQSRCLICASGYHQTVNGTCMLNFMTKMPLLTNYSFKVERRISELFSGLLVLIFSH